MVTSLEIRHAGPMKGKYTIIDIRNEYAYVIWLLGPPWEHLVSQEMDQAGSMIHSSWCKCASSWDIKEHKMRVNTVVTADFRYLSGEAYDIKYKLMREKIR